MEFLLSSFEYYRQRKIGPVDILNVRVRLKAPAVEIENAVTCATVRQINKILLFISFQDDRKSRPRA